MHGVCIQPINDANVSAARNHGMSIAGGELVRFLDDDDFLIPDIAVKQCKELQDSDADVSSYAIRIEDESRNVYSTLTQPVTPDFVSGQLSESRIQIPLAHVYRKDLIQKIRWNEKYSVSEDILWLHTVSQQCRINWLKSDDVVGVWYQHAGSRLSYAFLRMNPTKLLRNPFCLPRKLFHGNHASTMQEKRRRLPAYGLVSIKASIFILSTGIQLQNPHCVSNPPHIPTSACTSLVETTG